MNANYKNVFEFDNDYPALLPHATSAKMNHRDLLIAESESGICRVVCFSPRHDLTLSAMEVSDIRVVVDCWAASSRNLAHAVKSSTFKFSRIAARRWGPAIRIRTARSGPPPASRIFRESNRNRNWPTERPKILVCFAITMRSKCKEAIRIVAQNEQFLAVVPYWAVWPFETMIIPTRHLCAIDELDSNERDALAIF